MKTHPALTEPVTQAGPADVNQEHRTEERYCFKAASLSSDTQNAVINTTPPGTADGFSKKVRLQSQETLIAPSPLSAKHIPGEETGPSVSGLGASPPHEEPVLYRAHPAPSPALLLSQRPPCRGSAPTPTPDSTCTALHAADTPTTFQSCRQHTAQAFTFYSKIFVIIPHYPKLILVSCSTLNTQTQTRKCAKLHRN